VGVAICMGATLLLSWEAKKRSQFLNNLRTQRERERKKSISVMPAAWLTLGRLIFCRPFFFLSLLSAGRWSERALVGASEQ